MGADDPRGLGPQVLVAVLQEGQDRVHLLHAGRAILLDLPEGRQSSRRRLPFRQTIDECVSGQDVRSAPQRGPVEEGVAGLLQVFQPRAEGLGRVEPEVLAPLRHALAAHVGEEGEGISQDVGGEIAVLPDPTVPACTCLFEDGGVGGEDPEPQEDGQQIGDELMVVDLGREQPPAQQQLVGQLMRQGRHQALELGQPRAGDPDDGPARLEGVVMARGPGNLLVLDDLELDLLRVDPHHLAEELHEPPGAVVRPRVHVGEVIPHGTQHLRLQETIAAELVGQPEHPGLGPRLVPGIDGGFRPGSEPVEHEKWPRSPRW